MAILSAVASTAHAADIRFEFTHVPAYGSTETLQGIAEGIVPADYRVAPYIRVTGGWWTKPSFAEPTVSIHTDGTWEAVVANQPSDPSADRIAAWLIPAGVEPPRGEGQTELPAIAGAVAFEEATRGPQPRHVSFAGYQWRVKGSDSPVGPGPNYFSSRADEVWVDSEGLHLTIAKDGDRWLCSEVVLTESLGHGTYIIQTRGRIDTLDPNVVLGLFTWDGDAPEHHYREIDIEYTRWGDPGEYTNGQYVIQPWDWPDHLLRFRTDLTDAESDLTHYITWRPESVRFRTCRGRHIVAIPPESAKVEEWTYDGPGVPPAGGENFRFNLWLMDGLPPTNATGDSVVITGFAWRSLLSHTRNWTRY